MKEPYVVLLADTDQQTISLITSVVQNLGYTVLIARNAKDALELCEDSETPINIALIEIELPDMSGPELFSRLLVICPDAVVAYMSNESELAERIRRQHYGFIHKPVHQEAIVKIFHEFSAGFSQQK